MSTALLASHPPAPATFGHDPLDQLTLEYQAGRQQALGELHGVLEPLILQAVRQIAAMGLPSALEPRDLEQQSWLILDSLARRWRPELGTFAAYVFSSMPWALGRYVRRHSPARRARRVRVVAVENEELLRLLEARPGEDGRTWADRLIWKELLGRLPTLERDVFALRAVERRTFPAISARLGVSLSGVKRAFSRALTRLRDERRSVLGHQVELERLVLALHQGTSADGQLPGRAPVCEQAGLSQVQYGRLMKRLVAAGCIRGRTSRHPGWLVDPDPVATLRRVAVRAAERRAVSEALFLPRRRSPSLPSRLRPRARRGSG